MKKLLSTVLIVCLALSAIACNNTKNEESTDTTDFTTRATETAYDPSIKEPDQTINTMSPDQTTESAGTTESSVAQTSKYTYTVYAGTQYETVLSMDIDIDKYLIDKGEKVPFFAIASLGDDLGWYQNGDPNFDYKSKTVYCSYFYDDNTQMVWTCGDNYSGGDNATGYPQMGSFIYHLAPMSDYNADARSKEEIQSSEKLYGVYVTFGQHSGDLCYTTINNGDEVGISRDDAIVLAYIFSSAISKPGENPFYGTNLEKAKTSVADRYIMYTLP